MDDAEEPIISRLDSHSQRAELIRAASIIVWDEIFSARRQDVEAVDLALRDIMGNREAPFGGLFFVGVGSQASLGLHTFYRSYFFHETL